jgi:RNA polymerase sigma factor (sigma-70 family)
MTDLDDLIERALAATVDRARAERDIERVRLATARPGPWHDAAIDAPPGLSDDDVPVQPVVVLIAIGTTPSAQVFPASAGVVIGRQIKAEGRVEELGDDSVSREHATVRFTPDGWVVRDLDSHDGTFINGERISGESLIQGDAVMRLGDSVFLLVGDGDGYDATDYGGELVVGPELARTHALVRRLASSSTLLIHGERGSGKELIARLYHSSGPRANGPFVAVNCAAMSAGVAGQLFGARKGTFSGSPPVIGYLQEANGGTLFLDNVADLEPRVQEKLLHALKTREVMPIGATTPISIDLGVVATSHRPLRSEVAAGAFRDDLYYRLARSAVHVPPLRVRKLDIARLLMRELQAIERGLKAHPRLVETCCVRPWPGNVRELRNAARQAALSAVEHSRMIVLPEDLPLAADALLAKSGAVSLKSPVRESIIAAIKAANGDLRVAARALGLHRTQLYRLLNRYGVSPERGAYGKSAANVHQQGAVAVQLHGNGGQATPSRDVASSTLDAPPLRLLTQTGSTIEGDSAVEYEVKPTELKSIWVATEPTLTKVARRLLGNDADARDLVQDTFERAMRAWPHLREKSHGREWLTRILHSQFLDRARAARRSSVEPDESISESDTWEANLPPRISEALVRAAVEALAPDLRQVVDLCYLQQKSYREVAEILNLPISTVKTRVRRARLRLRELLEASESRPSVELDKIISESDKSEADTHPRISHAQLRAAIEALEPDLQQVVDLYYLQRKSYREVAEILNLPISTVASRMERARLRLIILIEASESRPNVEPDDIVSDSYESEVVEASESRKPTTS